MRAACRVVVGLLLMLVAGPASAKPAVLVNPPFFHLGAFSTLDPMGSDFVSGLVAVTVQSAVPWQLEVQLAGAATRITDGLELPLSRLTGTHPSIPEEIINLQPYIYTTGSGETSPFVISGSWLEVATNLQSYLDIGDPPGTYEVTLLLRLLNEQGNPLTDYVSATMQFDIEPWVYFVVAPLPSCEVIVPEGEVIGESDIVLVTISSNSAWELRVICEGDLVSENGSATLAMAGLSVCTDGVGTFGWRPRRSECEVAQPYPVAIASGSAPDPFTLAIEDVPVYLRYESSDDLSAGSYGTELRFEVGVDGFAR